MLSLIPPQLMIGGVAALTIWAGIWHFKEVHNARVDERTKQIQVCADQREVDKRAAEADFVKRASDLSAKLELQRAAEEKARQASDKKAEELEIELSKTKLAANVCWPASVVRKMR